MAGGLGIANLTGEVADFFGQAIEDASNLNETVSKSNVIFGENAEEVEDWAETAATSFGQSKRAALDTASTFAGLFDTVGLGVDESKEKAIELTKLGSDLASFFNTDVQEAIDALRSGLSGESEPLRKFNVFLSETAVNSELMAEGQQKVNGQWTEAQKITARYNIILKQTSDAQGDFARTADGLANSQRSLNAQLEDARAQMGQELLPLQLKVTQAQKDAIPVLITLFDAFDALGDTIGTVSYNLTNLLDDLTFWDGNTHRTAHNVIQSYRAVQRTSGIAADQIGVDARDMRQSIDGVGESAHDTADDMQDLEAAIEDVTDAAYDAVEAFGDQQFSADELKGRIADLTGELIEAEDELHELEAIRNPTAAQQRDIDSARGKVAGYRHDLLTARAELAKLNGTGLDQLLLELSKAQYRTDKLGDEAREALSYFQKLSFAEKKVTGFKGDPGYAPRAGGGPVWPGGAFWVGEQGPELFIPPTTGNIVSAPQSAAMAGGDKTQNIYVTVQGLIPYNDPLTIPKQLQRFGETGLLDWGLMGESR